jgi:hypothetical protein
LKTPTYDAANANMIACFKLINVGVLRFGDGSQDVWTPNGVGRTAAQTSPVDVNYLNGFLKAVGCQCLYGVNLGGYGPNPTGNSPSNPTTDGVATTPALAAAEAAYVSQTLGSSLYGIEIGNEPDGYINTFWYNQTPKYSVTTLESAWSTFQAAIAAQTPGIPITGPLCGTVLPVITQWTEPFAAAEGSKLSMLTQHYYRGNGQSSPLPTVQQLVSYPDTQLTASFLTPLQTTASQIGKPYRLTECNSYYAGGATGVSDAYASALWVIDFMYTCAQYGCAGVNFHGGITLNYTAITDNNGTVTGVRPLYYGMLMFALAGQGTLYSTTVSAGSLNLTAYAIKTAAGLSIIINNKDTAINAQVSLSLPQVANTTSIMVMTQSTSGAGPSLSALGGVTIQGSGVSATASFTPNTPYTVQAGSANLTVYVPYLSAILIQIT